MAEESETIEDIVGDIRAQNQGLPEDATALSPLVCDLLSLADRLEAAHRRERGDCAKLREALSKFCAYCAVVLNTGMFNRVHLEALLNMAKAALAAPARNCDRFNSGNAERDAEMAWDAITSGMDLQFSDLTDREIAIIKEAMRGFVWLFTTADESEAQEGGAK